MIRKKRAAEAVLFLPLLLAIGCDEEQSGYYEASQSSSCIPNQTLGCACPDGSQGSMLCTQSGVFTDCQCSSMLAYNAGSGGGIAGPVADPTVTDPLAGTNTQPGTDPAADPGAGDVPPPDPAADPGAGDVPPPDPAADPGAGDVPPPDPAPDPTGTDVVDDPVVDPGNVNTACITAGSVGDFTLLDKNALSPTFNQMRSIHDVCGKVLLVMYTSFH